MTTAVPSALKLLLVFAATALVVASCATSDVNPRQARANTGYADLYGKRASGLSWEVARFDATAGEFRRILSDYEPPEYGIVRLALATGRHRLRLTCLDQATTGPVDIEVEVEDGKITPVRVTMRKAGTTEAETEETSIGGTLYGRYGRRTKIIGDEQVMFQVSANSGPPVAYRLKAEMPYAQARSQ
jgi:hypothetical protein